MHLSYNQKETDSVTMYRVIFELLGTLAGIIAYTISFAIFVGDSTNNCADGRLKDYHKENAFRYHAVAVAVIIIISLLITFFSVKEQKEITQKKSSLSIFSALKQTWSFRPYRDLFFVELFSWLSVQFAQGNFVFYARYTLKLGDYYPYVVAIILVVNTLWLPMWHIISKRIGKKTSFVLGVWILMPILISLLFIDYFNYLIWLVGVLVGAGISAVYLLPWSMLPDVIDAASLKSGVRREELYYSFFVFGNKFSAGVTLAISTGLYQLFGYDQLSCIQPWTVPLLFKLLVSTPPVIFLLISLIFLHRYPINAAAREEIKAKLIKKRQLHQADDQSPIDSEGVSPTLTTSSLSYTNLDDDDDDVMVTASEDVTLKGRGPPITELKK
jgi:Na+/melibiose symporter-like transporter